MIRPGRFDFLLATTKTSHRMTDPPTMTPHPLRRFSPDIRRWLDLGAGGDFVTMERPELLATAIRELFRPLRDDPVS